jgi:hypothetical protein
MGSPNPKTNKNAGRGRVYRLVLLFRITNPKRNHEKMDSLLDVANWRSGSRGTDDARKRGSMGTPWKQQIPHHHALGGTPHTGMILPQNVKVMAHPLAGASVDHKVEVVIRMRHRKQRG